MNELLLLCLIAGRRAAIPASDVGSVIEIEDITPIPGTPPFIVGLTALRSQALTVIDSRIALGFEQDGSVIGQRAAVVEIEGHTYALVLDQAYDVAATIGELLPVPGGFGAGWQQASRSMVETAEGPVLVLDPQKLIAGMATLDA